LNKYHKKHHIITKMSRVATILYVKVRRLNYTAYVYTEPQQTIEVFAQYVGQMFKQDPNNIQFQFRGNVLEHAKTIQDYEIDKHNGATILMVFKNEDGSWETPNLHDPEPGTPPRDAIEAIKEQQEQAKKTTAQPTTTTSSSSSSSSSSSTTTDAIKDD
jgi:hypothetical protein